MARRVRRYKVGYEKMTKYPLFGGKGSYLVGYRYEFKTKTAAKKAVARLRKKREFRNPRYWIINRKKKR